METDPSVTLNGSMWIDAAFRALDSRLVSRIGNAKTIAGLVGLGLLLVIAVIAAVLTSVETMGWVLSVLFVLWLATSTWLAWSWTFGHGKGSVASLADRKVIALGLPRAKARAFQVLTAAQNRARELLAEITIVMPPLAHQKAAALARGFLELERDVGTVVADSDAFDERWQLMWEHRPSWVGDGITDPPLTLGQSKELAKYVAWRTRQIDSLVQYLEDGDDKPVRHIRTWIASEARAESSRE